MARPLRGVFVFAGQRLKANRADNFEPLDQCGFAKACPFKIWP
jgi:hypothetical protein